MDRQTSRDWVHAFDANGVDGLIDDSRPSRPCKLTDSQKAEIETPVENGPEFERDGILRWRCIDPAHVAEECFGDTIEDAMGSSLRRLDLSGISAQLRHPEQMDSEIESSKKIFAQIDVRIPAITQPVVWTLGCGFNLHRRYSS